MIARFKCQIVQDLLIPVSAYPSMLPARINIDDMEILLHPPRQAIEKLPNPQQSQQALSPNPPYFCIQEKPIVSNSTKIDSEGTISANLIFIDFKKCNVPDPPRQQIIA